jgi:hypothetical protein
VGSAASASTSKRRFMKSPRFFGIKAPAPQTGKGRGNPNLGAMLSFQEFTNGMDR